jgi:predicted transcriptional regulator
MELSYQLNTLKPLKGALDIIRFFGQLDRPTADSDEICDVLDLSYRSFGKAIRRLVTKGYMQMDGNQIYRLTEQGQKAVEELAAYDSEGGDDEDAFSEEIKTITRRLVMALPQMLVAGQPTNVIVGFHPASAEGTLEQPADMIVRLSVVNAEPAATQETTMSLSDAVEQHAFQIIPGLYTQVRLKVQTFQLGPNDDDISVAGGMYVDADVVASDGSADLMAYGADIQIALME